MSRWQQAARCAAYLAVLVLGAQWVWTAVLCLQIPAFGSDATTARDVLIALGKDGGLGGRTAFQVALMITVVKLILGNYLLVTVGIAAVRQIIFGRTDDARLDASLLMSVLAIMVMTAPLLTLGQIMPGTIDDLTLAVVGITLAALSKPEFIGAPISSAVPEAPSAAMQAATTT
jgi:hypothetical protein